MKRQKLWNKLEKFIKNKYPKLLREEKKADYIDLYIRSNTLGIFNVSDAKTLLYKRQKKLEPETLIYKEQRKFEYRIYEQSKNRTLYKHLGKRCIIVGRPGSGKTRYLKHLANTVLDKPGLFPDYFSGVDLPIYIDLGEFAKYDRLDEDDAFLKFIAKTFHQRYKRYLENVLLGEKIFEGDIRDYIQEKLKRGQTLLLLDGLDRTKQGYDYSNAQEVYRSVCAAIVNFTNEDNEYTESPIIISTRPRQITEDITENIEKDLPGFSNVAIIEDFRLEDIRAFAQNRTELLNSIDNNTRLQAFAALPQALEKMAAEQPVSRSLAFYLPLERAKLYKEFVDDYVKETMSEITVLARFSLLTPEQKQLLIEHIAWYMHNFETYRCPKGDLIKAIQEYLPHIIPDDQKTDWIRTSWIKSSERVFDEVILRDGLMRNEVEDTNYYIFPCITLQEYHVAHFIFRQRDVTLPSLPQQLRTLDKRQLARDGVCSIDELILKADHPWWEEVVLIYIYLLASEGDGQPGSVEEFLNKLDSETNCQIDQKILLEGYGLAMAGPSLTEDLQCKIQLRLYKSLNDAGCFSMRLRICRALAEFYERREVTKADLTRLIEFLEALDDKNGDYTDIKNKLKTWQEKLEGSLSPMLLPYFVACDNNIRKKLYRLAQVNTQEDLKILQGDELDLTLRMALVYALVALDKRNMAQHLASLLSKETHIINPSLKVCIVRALGFLGNENTVDTLFKNLKDSEVDAHLKWHIVSAIGVLGNRFGFWKKSCIAGQLREIQAGIANKEELAFVYWHIAVIIDALAFIHMESDPHKYNNGILNSIQDNKELAYLGIQILWDEGSPTSFDEFITYIQNNPPDIAKHQEWEYLWEAIFQCTLDVSILEKFKPYEPQNPNGNPTKLILANLVHDAKWRVERHAQFGRA